MRERQREKEREREREELNDIRYVKRPSYCQLTCDRTHLTRGVTVLHLDVIIMYEHLDFDAVFGVWHQGSQKTTLRHLAEEDSG